MLLLVSNFDNLFLIYRNSIDFVYLMSSNIAN